MSARKAPGYPGNREQRLKSGHAKRKHLSPEKLGKFDARKRKIHPLDILTHATGGRVAKLLPEKYGRMSVSPFAFFRGAVSIMAADLGGSPSSELPVQLCGDAHLQNLGSFGAPDGSLIFDVNDFDETIVGPWEWDVKRMAASIVLAGYDCEHRKSGCEEAVRAFAASYCKLIETLAEEPVLTTARYQIHRLDKARAVSAALQQAQRAKPADLVKRYTVKDAPGALHFKEVKNTLWPVTGKEKQDVINSLKLYTRSLAPERLHLFQFFRPLDVAYKIVGTGSVGLRDYVVLMEGNGIGDPLFLQIKQEVHSAFAAYLKHTAYDHQGRRAVAGQRKIQAVSDLLLGWTTIGKNDYLVRQLNDHKGSIDLSQLKGQGLKDLAVVAGELLARGHAKSGDPLAIKGYIGDCEELVKPLTAFGVKYAEVTADDFGHFKKAIKDGRIKANKPPAKV